VTRLAPTSGGRSPSIDRRTPIARCSNIMAGALSVTPCTRSLERSRGRRWSSSRDEVLEGTATIRDPAQGSQMAERLSGIADRVQIGISHAGDQRVSIDLLNGITPVLKFRSPERRAILEATVRYLVDVQGIEIISRSAYEQFEEVAVRRVLRDPNDWAPVALAMAFDAGILTGDHDFLCIGVAGRCPGLPDRSACTLPGSTRGTSCSSKSTRCT